VSLEIRKLVVQTVGGGGMDQAGAKVRSRVRGPGERGEGMDWGRGRFQPGEKNEDGWLGVGLVIGGVTRTEE